MEFSLSMVHRRDTALPPRHATRVATGGRSRIGAQETGQRICCCERLTFGPPKPEAAASLAQGRRAYVRVTKGISR